MALFITLEGVEGCGKSVQAKSLYRRLSRLAIPALLLHEPGGTPLGKKISYWLKWGRDTASPLIELFLFNACRAQLIAEIIKPNLKSGKIIVCDRFVDSSTAYQGYGRGLDLDMVKRMNSVATQGLEPDLTFLLDIPVEQGLGRKRTKRRDRFEREDITFHERVREGYLKLAASEPERWLVIDATQPKAKIGQIIWQRVSQLLTPSGQSYGKAR